MGIYPINTHYIRCIWGWLLRVPSQGYHHFPYEWGVNNNPHDKIQGTDGTRAPWSNRCRSTRVVVNPCRPDWTPVFLSRVCFSRRNFRGGRVPSLSLRTKEFKRNTEPTQNNTIKWYIFLELHVFNSWGFLMMKTECPTQVTVDGWNNLGVNHLKTTNRKRPWADFRPDFWTIKTGYIVFFFICQHSYLFVGRFFFPKTPWDVMEYQVASCFFVVLRGVCASFFVLLEDTLSSVWVQCPKKIGGPTYLIIIPFSLSS